MRNRALFVAIIGGAMLASCSTNTQAPESKAPERQTLDIEVATVYSVVRQDSTHVWLYMDTDREDKETTAVRYRTTLDTIPVGLRMYFIRLPGGSNPNAIYGHTNIIPYQLLFENKSKLKKAGYHLRYTYGYRPYEAWVTYEEDFTIGKPFTVLAQTDESN